MKKCKKCGKIKANNRFRIHNFYINKFGIRQDYFDSYCCLCETKYNKKERRQYFREYNRNWYKSLKGKAYSKLYYRTHLKHILERCQNYRKKNYLKYAQYIKLWNKTLNGKLRYKVYRHNCRIKTKSLTNEVIKQVYENNQKKIWCFNLLSLF